MKNVAPENTRIDLLKRQNESYFEGMKNLTELVSPSSEEIEATKEFIANKVQANFEEQSEIENPVAYYKNKAKEMWRANLIISGKNSNYISIAEIYEKLGETDKAQENLNIYLNTDKETYENSSEAVLKAQIYEKVGHTDKANNAYLRAINLNLSDECEDLILDLNAKAIAYEKLEMKKEAQDMYGKLATEYKRVNEEYNSGSYCCHSLVYYKKTEETKELQKKLMEGVAWLKNPINIEGDVLTLDDIIGDDRDYEAILELYKEIGDFELLKPVLEVYAEHSEKNLSFNKAAQMKEILGNKDEAIRLWKKAVDLGLNPRKYYGDNADKYVIWHDMVADAYENLARLSEELNS